MPRQHLRRLHRRAIWDTETTATAASLRTLARRIQLLNTEISNHTQTVTTLVRAWRPELLTRRGWPDRGRRRPVRLVSPGLLPHRHSLPLLGDAADPASSGQTVGCG